MYSVKFDPNCTPRGSFNAETEDGREIKPDSKVPAGTIVRVTAAANKGFEICSWIITSGIEASTLVHSMNNVFLGLIPCFTDSSLQFEASDSDTALL